MSLNKEYKMKKTIFLSLIFAFCLFFQFISIPQVNADQLTLTSTYSTDVNSSGTKYYHDGADWLQSS